MNWEWLQYYNWLFMLSLTNQSYNIKNSVRLSKKELELEIKKTLDIIYIINNFEYHIMNN